MSKSVEERAHSIYSEMMDILEERGDDKEVVRAVLTAFFGAYLDFMKANPEQPS